MKNCTQIIFKKTTRKNYDKCNNVIAALFDELNDIDEIVEITKLETQDGATNKDKAKILNIVLDMYPDSIVCLHLNEEKELLLAKKNSEFFNAFGFFQINEFVRLCGIMDSEESKKCTYLYTKNSIGKRKFKSILKIILNSKYGTKAIKYCK